MEGLDSGAGRELEFGLDTFGDVPEEDAGRLLPYAAAIRQVLDEAVLADRFGVDVIALGEQERRCPPSPDNGRSDHVPQAGMLRPTVPGRQPASPVDPRSGVRVSQPIHHVAHDAA